MVILLNPADKMVPLQQGDGLFIDNQPSVPKTEPRFALFVAFGESAVAQGEPVLETAFAFRDKVEATLEDIAPLLASQLHCARSAINVVPVQSSERGIALKEIASGPLAVFRKERPLGLRFLIA